jgi:peptidoglycan endopeptidase LytE
MLGMSTPSSGRRTTPAATAALRPIRKTASCAIPAPTTAPASPGLDTAVASVTETYTVKSGDTLSRIARQHGTTVAALKELNGLTLDSIKAGQKLKLPAKPAPAEPASPVVPFTLPPATNPATPPPLASAPVSR